MYKKITNEVFMHFNVDENVCGQIQGNHVNHDLNGWTDREKITELNDWFLYLFLININCVETFPNQWIKYYLFNMGFLNQIL